MSRHAAWLTLALAALALRAALGGFVTLRDGFLFDPDANAPFLPTGFAYQTFNQFVFATQTLDQVDYDLEQMRAAGANSVRVEFTWSFIETQPEVYDWSRQDFLVRAAERHGLKLLVLVGYQYPPTWVKDVAPHLLARHYDSQSRTFGRSELLNYNHPEAAALFRGFLTQVCGRYRDSPAIYAWILGNEFAYYDLWEDPNLYPAKRIVGYDTEYSLPSMRAFMAQRYGSIAALNAAWGTTYSSFVEIPMPLGFPPSRSNHTYIRSSGYNDILRWREESVARFLAQGAVAAAAADPNHLRTYAMVGGIFNGYDSNIASENPPLILRRCAEAGAPMHFWTINNYPFPYDGDMRSIACGVAKFRDVLGGVPVLVSETGASNTDSLFPEAFTRAELTVPSLIWETLLSGAIGVHIFHWSDRDDFIAYGYPLNREAGFGVVRQSRLPKSTLALVSRVFHRVEEVGLSRLLPRSRLSARDVVVLWSDDAGLTSNSFNQEVMMNYAGFLRGGFRAGFVNDARWLSGNISARAVYLPRNMQMSAAAMTRLRAYLDAGVHVHAGTDMVGEFDEVHRRRPESDALMRDYFGLNFSAAFPALDGWGVPEPNTTFFANFDPIFAQTVGAYASSGYFGNGFMTWKVWHNLSTVAGDTAMLHYGRNGTRPLGEPGVQLLTRSTPAGDSRTAFSSFTTGDLVSQTFRSQLWRLIYQRHFGIAPWLTAVDTEADRLASDYRILADGSVLMWALNIRNRTANASLSAPGVLRSGVIVEDLVNGGFPTLEAGDTVLPVVIPSDSIGVWVVRNASLNLSDGVSQAGFRVWPTAVPSLFFPRDAPFEVTVGAATLGLAPARVRVALRVNDEDVFSGEAALAEPRNQTRVSVNVSLRVQSFDFGFVGRLSSAAGALWSLRVQLLAGSSGGGEVLAEATRSATFSWGVRTALPPPPPVPGGSFAFSVFYEGLREFSYGGEFEAPLSRAAVWLTEGSGDAYSVELAVRNGEHAVVANWSALVTSTQGFIAFNGTVPAAAAAAPQPLYWTCTATPLASAPVVAAKRALFNSTLSSAPPLPPNVTVAPASAQTSYSTPHRASPTTFVLRALVSKGGNAVAGVALLWTLSSGPGLASFTSPLLSETEATFSQPGTYVVALRMWNGFNLSTSTLLVDVPLGRDTSSRAAARFDFGVHASRDLTGNENHGASVSGRVRDGVLRGVMSVGDSASLRLGPNCSVAVWASLDPEPPYNDQVLLSKKPTWNAPQGYEFLFDNRTRRIKFLGSESGPFAEAVSPALSPNRWYHFAASVLNGAVRIYLDGVELTQRSGAQPVLGPWPGSSSLYIGGNGEGDRKWVGGVQQVTLYARPLSGQEIVALASQVPPFDASSALGRVGARSALAWVVATVLVVLASLSTVC